MQKLVIFRSFETIFFRGSKLIGQSFTLFAFCSIVIVSNLSKWSMSGTPWIEMTACCVKSVVSGFSGCGVYVTTSPTETCLPKLIWKQKKKIMRKWEENFSQFLSLETAGTLLFLSYVCFSRTFLSRVVVRLHGVNNLPRAEGWRALSR